MENSLKKELIIDALVRHYESVLATKTANLRIYLESPMGIGEHSEVVEEGIKLVAECSAASDTLTYIKDNFVKRVS